MWAGAAASGPGGGNARVAGVVTVFLKPWALCGVSRTSRILENPAFIPSNTTASRPLLFLCETRPRVCPVPAAHLSPRPSPVLSVVPALIHLPAGFLLLMAVFLIPGGSLWFFSEHDVSAHNLDIILKLFPSYPEINLSEVF